MKYKLEGRLLECRSRQEMRAAQEGVHMSALFTNLRVAKAMLERRSSILTPAFLRKSCCGITLNFAGQTALISTPLLIGLLVDTLTEAPDQISFALGLTLAYGVSMWASRGLFELSDYNLLKLINDASHTLRVESTGHILSVKKSEYDDGSLLAITERGIAAFSEILNALLFRLAPKALTLCGIFTVVLMNYSALMLLIALIGGSVYALWLIFISNKLHSAVTENNKAEEGISSYLSEFLSQRRLFQLYSPGNGVYAPFETASRRSRDSEDNLVWVQTQWAVGNGFIVATVIGTLLCVALFSYTPTSGPGALVTLTYLAAMMFGPIDEIANGIAALHAASAKFESFANLLTREKVKTYLESPGTWNSISLVVQPEKISPNHLRLASFSLTIRPGQKVALVGPSGIGKTTLGEWIYDQLAQQEVGDREKSNDLVRIDGKVKPLYLPQETLMLNADTWTNITLCRSVWKSNEEFSSIINMLGFSPQFTKRAMNGTSAGAQGANFSGGERRRIALGRVLFGASNILILDEPFSGLDEGTYEALLKELISLDETIIFLLHDVRHPHYFDSVIELREETIPSRVDLVATAAVTA